MVLEHRANRILIMHRKTRGGEYTYIYISYRATRLYERAVVS